MPTVARSSQQRSRRRRSPNLKLIELRVNAGLSREQLARKTGLGRETIRIAEAGFVPTPRVQFALARAFPLDERDAATLGRETHLPLDIWPLEDQPRPSTARGAR